MASLHLEIVTPERIAYTDEVDMVTIQSSNGQLGILPYHVSLFTEIVEGEIKIIKGRDEVFLAVGGGFMEVIENKVMILVTRAVHADELNENEVFLAKERAAEILKTKPAGEALEAAHAAFQRSLLELRVMRRRKKAYPSS